MEWTQARARLEQPVFAPLRAAIDPLPRDRWPAHEELSRLAAHVFTSRGHRVHFVAPREHGDRERRYYELRIAQTGEVETRPESWHDLFNALAWIAYPRAKAMINAQHAAILGERGDAEAKHRGPERDALTLFDEGGVAVLSDDPVFFDRIRDFEWKRAFWTEREALSRHVRFLAFGHALFENALEPHLGMVAKTVFLSVARIPPDEALVAAVDELLGAHFTERARFARPKLMAPMPVLGIPGWHERTSDESFYDDRAHFRGKVPR
jgi:hypothetical protein